MINLLSTSDKIQLVTVGVVDVIDVHATYVDWVGAVPTPGRRNTAITTATTTDIVTAPGAGVSRVVESLHIRSLNSIIPQTVTARHTDGATPVDLFQADIAIDGRLSYLDGEGWDLFDLVGGEV